MLAKFDSKKRHLLDRLSQSRDQYTDASPKGSVDEGVRRLVNEVNRLPGFVTTSSCSGRISVFLEGPPTQRADTDIRVEDDEVTTLVLSTGGKGGGRWLFTSHDPVDLEHFAEPGALSRYLGVPAAAQIASPPKSGSLQFVHFKFEPMILHILTGSAESAQAALHAAMTAGFRESGISGLMDSQGRPTPPMVAVRSSGYAFDSIIGFKCTDPTSPLANQVTPMVSEAYLHTLVEVANQRFHVNDERKERFRAAFANQIGVREMRLEDLDVLEAGAQKRGYESASVRSARKRKEGLAERERIFFDAGQLDGGLEQDDETEAGAEEDDESLGLDLLLTSDENPTGQKDVAKLNGDIEHG